MILMQLAQSRMRGLPTELFRGGNAGVFLNFSDANRYQDAAGKTLATADTDPLGLIYDLKNGVPVLGANIKSTGLVGLVGDATAATYNTVTGVGSVSRVDSGNQSYVAFYGLTVGLFYQFTIQNTSATNVIIRSVNPTGPAIYTVMGNTTATFVCNAPPNGALILTSGVGSTGFILSSMRWLPGNHAYQVTPTARPLLYTTPYYYAKFDLADDVLHTYLPAITGGTICLITSSGTWFNSITKAAGVLALGPTTYTGGPAGLLDALKNGAADFRLISYIVINKALSASEKAAIVSWGRARGGQGEVVYP